MPGHTSACVFVIPISTPAVFAAAFAPNTFVRGGAPSKTATGLFRSSGSKRTTACTEKSGTKRHAQGTMNSSGEEPETGGETVTSKNYRTTDCAFPNGRNRPAPAFENARVPLRLRNPGKSKHSCPWKRQQGPTFPACDSIGGLVTHNPWRKALL